MATSNQVKLSLENENEPFESKGSLKFPMNFLGSSPYSPPRAPLLELAIPIKRTPSPDARSSTLSPQRRRPRGSEVGKSIHKAAEASVSSLISLQPSPDLASQQRRDRRLSFGPLTRMTPAPPNKEELDKWRSDEDSQSDSGHYSSATVAASLSRSSKLSRSRISEYATSQARSMNNSSRPQWANRTTIRNFDDPNAAQNNSSRHLSTSNTSLTGKDFSPPFSHASEKSQSTEPTKVRSGEGVLPPDDRPPQALVDAFEKLSLYSLYFHQIKRLPFLTRNLRKSFRRLCQELKIFPNSRNPFPHGQSIPLIYHYTPFSNGTTYDTYKTSLGTLECPICSLFGPFSSWKALQKHLWWDHEEIKVFLNQQVDEHGSRFSQVLIYLRGNTSLPEAAISLHKEAKETVESTYQTSSTYLSQALPAPSRDIQPSNITMKIENQDSVDSLVPQLAHSHLVLPEKDVITREVRPLDHVSGKLPDIKPSLRVFQQFRAITPPPISNPHGPAHPIVGPDGDTSKNPISYRPTGPHLYDHLSSLPLEPYGNRAWFVLDKEEEIFELTDVLDEDKVICALWGRWILLNRQSFIANYFTGIEAFVDQYWQIIHYAAGWGSLRAWLLVLVSKRFLTNIQMVKVLKRYNELVGKENWYK